MTKIRLWYGPPKLGDTKIKEKFLGIQCEYLNKITGNLITSEKHCTELSGDDIEIKELEVKNND